MWLDNLFKTIILVYYKLITINKGGFVCNHCILKFVDAYNKENI